MTIGMAMRSQTHYSALIRNQFSCYPIFTIRSEQIGSTGMPARIQTKICGFPQSLLPNARIVAYFELCHDHCLQSPFKLNTHYYLIRSHCVLVYSVVYIVSHEHFTSIFRSKCLRPGRSTLCT
jgi:hypothetical protein